MPKFRGHRSRLILNELKNKNPSEKVDLQDGASGRKGGDGAPETEADRVDKIDNEETARIVSG